MHLENNLTEKFTHLSSISTSPVFLSFWVLTQVLRGRALTKNLWLVQPWQLSKLLSVKRTSKFITSRPKKEKKTTKTTTLHERDNIFTCFSQLITFLYFTWSKFRLWKPHKEFALCIDLTIFLLEFLTYRLSIIKNVRLIHFYFLLDLQTLNNKYPRWCFTFPLYTKFFSPRFFSYKEKITFKSPNSLFSFLFCISSSD